MRRIKVRPGQIMKKKKEGEKKGGRQKKGGEQEIGHGGNEREKM